MTKEAQLKYAEYFLTHNIFFDFELAGYMGKDDYYVPHGIQPDIWKQASKNVGFIWENLTETSDGKFYLQAKDLI